MQNRMSLATLLAITWTFLVLLSTSIPLPTETIPEVASRFPFFDIPLDKVAHAGLFGIFALLWGLASVNLKFWPLRVALAGLAFGALTEAVQAIPALHRDADWGDLLADCVGIVCGVSLAWLINRVRRGRRSTEPAAAHRSQHHSVVERRESIRA
jgi:hypothetical protein